MGDRLVHLERGFLVYDVRSEKTQDEFRQGVVFVPVEVLESYLEDLLDIKVPESSLFIEPRVDHWRRVIITAITAVMVCATLLMGFFAWRAGATHLASWAAPVVVILFLSFMLWSLYPRYGASRRMAFAQIVSHEIARRRGKGPRKKVNTTFSDIMEIFQGQAVGDFSRISAERI